MKPILDEARREFIAKIVADLGKTIFAIGLASYFFEKFSAMMRVTLAIICIISLIGSTFIQPKTKGE